MRLAGGSKLEHHTGNPTAAGITSIGAGTPSRARTRRRPARREPPILRSPSRPHEVRQRRSRLRVREIDERLPGPSATSTSSRAGVALTTRSAPSTSGGHSLRREYRRAPAGPARTPWPSRRRRDHRAFGREPRRDRGVRRPALDLRIPDDQRVHRGSVGPAERGDGQLVRSRDVRSDEAEGSEPFTAASSRSGGVGAERMPSRARRREGSVLHARRERVSTGHPMRPTSFVAPVISIIRRRERPAPAAGLPGSAHAPARTPSGELVTRYEPHPCRSSLATGSRRPLGVTRNAIDRTRQTFPSGYATIRVGSEEDPEQLGAARSRNRFPLTSRSSASRICSSSSSVPPMNAHRSGSSARRSTSNAPSRSMSAVTPILRGTFGVGAPGSR